MIKCKECGREITPDMKFAIKMGKCPYCCASIKEEKKEKPTSCSKCPNYSVTPYSCHNERGYETHCSTGCMKNRDTRDWNYRLSREIYTGCPLYS